MRIDPQLSSRGLFITGTDTDAGKTVASTALVHALRRGGARVVGMKPVASGCARTPEGWRNADALALQQASDPRPDYLLVNPFALRDPTAPQLAARAAGVAVTLAPMLAAYATLAAMADRVVVEGVGGWLAPLADGLEQSDLVKALDLPVVLVVGLKLGCLNHARLTARAIAADGCRLQGWIGSIVEPGFPDDYVDLVRAALPVPCLGVLPHDAGASPAARAGYLSVG
jgi:dethiobiotin synthetase